MLYTFRVRRELQRARQELSHSLYRNDAALRTIARLNQQLTAARSALAGMERPDPVTAMEINAARSALAGMERPDPVTAMEINAGEELGLDKDFLDQLDAKSEALTTARRQRGKEPPQTDAKVEELQRMELKRENKNLHDSNPPGILSLDLQGTMTATGGVDKKVILYNLESDEIEATFVGHRKKISSVLLLPNLETVLSDSNMEKR
uniref:Pre-mRNA-processing factor 19 n=1 Tax=Panagrolaimus sp. JU765 TaxID=591449 RepID=A0AC34Q132_9BILA